MKYKELLTDLFDAISCGSNIRLLVALFQLSPEEKRLVLEMPREEAYGEESTPLFFAVKRKQKTIVKILVQNFDFDKDVPCTIEMDGIMVRGATPLWAAAAFGQFEIVQYLVEAGAQINIFTGTRSTPLRAACYDGRLDIVKYLVECGADINLANAFDNTCLMIATHRGFSDIVTYLLDNGADCNAKAHCGATALTFAAEKGFSRIVTILASRGAEYIRNSDGMTPLLIAAENCNTNVIPVMAKLYDISMEEEIDAFELAGATFANDSDYYNPEMAIHLWKHAMTLRNSRWPPLFKKLAPPVPAYGNRIECLTLEEVLALENDIDAIHMESLVIRERILGTSYPDLLHCIIYRGAVFAEENEFDRCLTLWLHALQISNDAGLSVTKELLRFCQVFSMMIELGIHIDYCTLRYLFLSAVLEVRRHVLNRPLDPVTLITMGPLKTFQDELELSYHVILYLIAIFYSISNSLEEYQQMEIKKLIHQILISQPSDYTGMSLLHLSLCCDKGVEIADPLNICSFPSPKLAKLLIECGANVNAMTLYRETPLHIILNNSSPGYDAIFEAVTALLVAGAHIDIVDSFGKTPRESAASGHAREVITHFLQERPLSLKCLAAKCWKKTGQMCDFLPAELSQFAELHGRGELTLPYYEVKLVD